MSKRKPTYASQVPYVPMDWSDRDAVTGRILEILEAVMPEGRQLAATKNLVKESTKQYFIESFNNQYEALICIDDLNIGYARDKYYQALWEATEEQPATGVVQGNVN